MFGNWIHGFANPLDPCFSFLVQSWEPLVVSRSLRVRLQESYFECDSKALTNLAYRGNNIIQAIQDLLKALVGSEGNAYL